VEPHEPAKIRLDPVNVDRVSEPWVSADTIADHLGITSDTIDSWISTKDMPAHRVGRLWKVKVSDIEEWVRNDGFAAPAGSA
jgi:excisionase family DNA binding protein